MSLGSRRTFLLSGNLIHPAIWPEHIWAENWGCVPLGEGQLGPHLTQYGQAEAYMHAKFYLDPSNRLVTIHQRYRQTDRTGQTDNGLIAYGKPFAPKRQFKKVCVLQRHSIFAGCRIQLIELNVDLLSGPGRRPLARRAGCIAHEVAGQRPGLKISAWTPSMTVHPH